VHRTCPCPSIEFLRALVIQGLLQVTNDTDMISLAGAISLRATRSLWAERAQLCGAVQTVHHGCPRVIRRIGLLRPLSRSALRTGRFGTLNVDGEAGNIGDSTTRLWWESWTRRLDRTSTAAGIHRHSHFR
jgi:hypothetical protein